MTKRNYKRTRKLIQPKFQMKIAFACLGIAVMATLVLTVLLNQVVLDFADKGWIDSARVEQEWIGVLVTKLLIALAVLTPMTLALGVILMHRVAGPLYRFRQFVRAVAHGEHPNECRLRKNDELMDFCDLLNRFTAPVRNGTVDYRVFAEALGDHAAALEVDEDADVGESAPAERAKRVPALES
jgi:hypothetical protein